MNTSPMLAWARRYRALGYHPIPVIPGTKRPAVDWKRFQDVPPTDPEITEWWTTSPQSGIALVMGRGGFAVDLDGGDAAEHLLRDAGVTLPPDAPRSRTGGGGYHVLLAGAVGDAVALVQDASLAHCQVDIRGKGIIVAPPTIHPSGTPYQWDVIPVAYDALPPAPESLLTLLAGRTEAASSSPPPAASSPAGMGWVDTALLGVGQGSRADTCVRLAGYLLGRGLPRDTVSTILQTGFGPRCTPPYPAADIAKTVESIARRDACTNTTPHAVAPEHISTVLASLEAQRLAGPTPAIPTGFADLDWDLQGGFHPGELIYLGARPGVGKTAMALQIALEAARRRHPTLVISREMVNTALVRRMMSQSARVHARALRGGALSGRDQAAYDSARADAATLPLWLTDQVVSLTDIIALLEATEVTHGAPLGLIVIDYLQLVRAPSEVRERRHQVEAVSQGLKSLALQYRTPILCLSSLSRPQADRPDAKPTLASLRESGELEHDADVVIFLHRGMDATTATAIVAKNREGRTGERELLFAPDTLTFRSVERDPAA